MSRDKQSLEEIKGYDDSYWLRYLAENTIFDTENIKAQKDWLINQLAAEKERADDAEGKAKFWEMEYYALNREYTEYRTLYPKEGGQ